MRFRIQCCDGVFIAMVIVALWFQLGVAQEKAAPIPVPEGHFTDVVRPALEKYCVECHSPTDESDPVGFLKAETADQVASDRAIWSSVAEQLVNRTMPPADEAQPSERERLEIAHWIERHLYETACDQGEFAGAPVPRRLNREQYEYAIEDLTGVEFDFVQTFPSDGGGGEGFNNNGELLFLPPLLMERYLEVARDITDRVVDVPPFDRTSVPRRVEPGQRSRKRDADGVHWRMVTPSGSKIERELCILSAEDRASWSVVVYSGGDYELRSLLKRQPKVDSTLQIRLDGKRLKTVTLSGPSDTAEIRQRVRLSKGPHVLAWKLSEESPSVELKSVRLRQNDSASSGDRRASTAKLFAPGAALIEDAPRQACRQIVGAFARRAWRRPINAAESDRLVALYDRGRARGEPFAQAIKLPLQAVLVSPHFLLAAEGGQSGPADGPLSDLELATRLSLFLWHSIPDEKLLQAAIDGKLHQSDELDRQIDRMLADPKSMRFAKEFAGQWLGTKAVGRTVIPDTNFFKPAYTSELVTDLRRQVTETMSWMIRNNRPITDWIGSDYVLVNRRLAVHYGLTEVPDGDQRFEKVDLSDSPRTGIVGMGAVHMLTSYSRRTSPVLRGGWVLETVFGVHLPSPPPDAGTLPGGAKESGKKTVRQRLEEHRSDPTCAACHDLIDPIGFAMENYDVLGRWRDKEGDNPIDSAGTLPSGETVDGPKELKRVLLERSGEFREQLCRKMLGYALGRSLVDADACTINQISEATEREGDGMVSLIKAVVLSHPFRFRQGFSE